MGDHEATDESLEPEDGAVLEPEDDEVLEPKDDEVLERAKRPTIAARALGRFVLGALATLVLFVPTSGLSAWFLVVAIAFVPLAWLEVWVEEARGSRAPVGAAAAWLVGAIAFLLGLLQALYAQVVVSSGSVDAGLARVQAIVTTMRPFEPFDAWLVGALFAASSAAAFLARSTESFAQWSLALVIGALLVEPLAVAFHGWRHLGQDLVGAIVMFAFSWLSAIALWKSLGVADRVGSFLIAKLARWLG